jgi:hypothetical protein
MNTEYTFSQLLFFWKIKQDLWDDFAVCIFLLLLLSNCFGKRGPAANTTHEIIGEIMFSVRSVS